MLVHLLGAEQSQGLEKFQQQSEEGMFSLTMYYVF